MVQIQRCAQVTRQLGVDPVGTAGTYDRFVLVEVPLPWPADIADHPLLGAVGTVPATTVLAVCGDSSPADGSIGVTVWSRRSANAMAGTDHMVPHATAATQIAALAGGAPSVGSVVGVAPPEVLLCGHGKRDRCCGQLGTRLHVAVADRWDCVRVRRCSHTGGHRFAPTGLTFPEGRAWAYLDEAVLDQVVGRSGDPSRLVAHDRGSSGFESWAQPLDRALLGFLGWAWLDAEVRSCSVTVEPDARSARVEVTWHSASGAAGRARGRVEVRRRVPVPVCGEPPEVAGKVSLELALRAWELEDGRPADPIAGIER